MGEQSASFNAATYGQVGQGADQVTCSLKPEAGCLAIECEATQITATLDYRLFDDQNVDAATTKEALEAGNREFAFDCTDVPDITYEDDAAVLVWGIGSNCLSPRVDGDDLVYSFSVSLNDVDSDHAGLAQGIEFHTDTTVNGQCTYPTEITLSNEFWVNQEDVEARRENEGAFDANFECNFSTDQDFVTKLEEENIVNMGDTIYGQLVSTEAIPRISYQLTALVVTDPNEDDHSFDIFAQQGIVNGNFPDQPTATGQNYAFDWTSFGFQGLSNQNQLALQCQVKLVLNDE